MALGELSVGKPPSPFDEGRALRGSFSLRDALRAVNAGVSEAGTKDRFESQLVRLAIFRRIIGSGTTRLGRSDRVARRVSRRGVKRRTMTSCRGLNFNR